MARLMARLVVLVCIACALMADAEQVDVEAGKLIGDEPCWFCPFCPCTFADSVLLAFCSDCILSAADLGAGKHDLADLVNHMSHASPGTVSGKPSPPAN